MNRAEAVAQLQAVWGVLNADLECALAYGRQNNTAYAQRALVRAWFALVEGLSYQLRQVTLATLHDTNILSASEIALLSEERYFVDDKGRPKTSEQFLPFPQSLLFSIRAYAKNHGAQFEADTAQPGWSAMRRAVEVRNRVTHPKAAKSLSLSEEDLQSFSEAAAWWKATMLSMFAACNEADEYWRRELEAQA
ncbi:MAG TPA: hypothetical protein VNJ47_12160 [Nevskiales bacterium]|nr:hypothetical protein [Nevskiales bacterium]